MRISMVKYVAKKTSVTMKKTSWTDRVPTQSKLNLQLATKRRLLKMVGPLLGWHLKENQNETCLGGTAIF